MPCRDFRLLWQNYPQWRFQSNRVRSILNTLRCTTAASNPCLKRKLRPVHAGNIRSSRPPLEGQECQLIPTVLHGMQSVAQTPMKAMMLANLSHCAIRSYVKHIKNSSGQLVGEPPRVR